MGCSDVGSRVYVPVVAAHPCAHPAYLLHIIPFPSPARRENVQLRAILRTAMYCCGDTILHALQREHREHRRVVTAGSFSINAGQ